jgi:hypothetical protein
MIIVKITSGLGNQLFQYFTALSISQKINSDLYLDLSAFKNDKLRKFELNQFNLSYKIYKPKLLDIFKFQILKDKQLGFQHNVLSKNDIYLKGYWQSYKYFDYIKDEIYKSIPRKIDLHKKFNKKKSVNFVSIHVRRGDYITNPRINRRFKTCSVEYFNKSIKLLESKENNLQLVFFSEDFNYIKQTFSKYKDAIFLKPDINNPLNDLAIMYNCNHNIISNSTFSWWGAWLNKTPNKKVICPDSWFFLDKDNFFLKDLIPNDWLQIEND